MVVVEYTHTERFQMKQYIAGAISCLVIVVVLSGIYGDLPRSPWGLERYANILTPIKVRVQAVSEQDDLIFETKYWRVVLVSKDQRLLGRAKVRLNGSCGDINCLTKEELDQWHRIVGAYQEAVRAAFGAKLFNWASLKNNTYDHPPVIPHIHWHVWPRYSAPVRFAGEVFRDPAFGRWLAFDDREERPVSKAVKRQIINAIRDELEKLPGAFIKPKKV